MIINIIIMTRTTVLDSNEIKDRIGYINLPERGHINKDRIG